MTAFPYGQLLMALLPEVLVTLSALLVLLVDLGVLRRESASLRFGFAGGLTGFGALAAMFWMATMGEHGTFLGGALIISPFTQWLKAGLLVLTAAVVLLFIDGDFTEHVGEFVGLILLATLGMMLLVSAGDLLLLFIALELASLSLYCLVAFDKARADGAGAALQYFLYGGMAAAFLLFGFSLLYGLGGTILLRDLGLALGAKAGDPALLLALVLVIAGLGFKIAAVPFHLWSPAVYQSAPGPSAALIASGSKLASIVVFARLTSSGLGANGGNAAWGEYQLGWMPLVAVLAAFSMVLGNLAALGQVGLRRLIAFSGVAHAGYLLLGILSQETAGLQSVAFYAFTYGLATIGLFGIAVCVERHHQSDALPHLAGLGRRSPVVGVCLLVFVLSLAGLPPLAGFAGKFQIFLSAASVRPPGLGLLWLVALAILSSALSLYYYLQILKHALVTDSSDQGSSPLVPLAPTVVLVVLASILILLGCFPELAWGVLSRAALGSW